MDAACMSLFLFWKMCTKLKYSAINFDPKAHYIFSFSHCTLEHIRSFPQSGLLYIQTRNIHELNHQTTRSNYFVGFKSESGSGALLKFKESIQYFIKFDDLLPIWHYLFFNGHKKDPHIRNPSWTVRFPSCRYSTTETMSRGKAYLPVPPHPNYLHIPRSLCMVYWRALTPIKSLSFI